jgi:hypothetical protein
MKTLHEDDQSASLRRRSMRITMRHAHNAVDAERLLPLSVLERLCPGDPRNRVRQRNVYSSHVIVAFIGDAAVGFVAYKATIGTVRIAHELGVDLQAPDGHAPVTLAILKRLEFVVRVAACSRVIVVLPASTPLRRFLETSGHRVHFGAAEMLWFEKRLVDEEPPLKSA